ncbi:MAG: hypothetical protein NUV74_05410 [Candidatus Brocadiaceae bacterium]|nr:hypothetical protein [Candidatus Brocadiaceae bacterium]
MSNHGQTEPYDGRQQEQDEQQQDMAERDRRLRDILIELHSLAVAYPSDHRTAVAEDIDFIATYCGLSDYRK